MTIENESVFNSQTSPGTPTPQKINRRSNTPYTSTGTRKRSNRKSLNFVRKKKVGGKLVEIGKTKNKDISDLIDKIIIKNNPQSVQQSDLSQKLDSVSNQKPHEIREFPAEDPSRFQIQDEANRQADKIQSILHQSTFKPKVDKFDLSKIQSAAGRDQKQVIYKSLIKQPFFDKIVEKEYYNSKSSRRKSFACLSDIDSSLITGAIEKVDYKDFGHYVDDCKKHYALSMNLQKYRKTNGGGPVSHV
jgi:uncharacterized protein YeeX (DUF496 family)